MSVEDIRDDVDLNRTTIRKIRARLWAILRARNQERFVGAGNLLGASGNVVEVDESRFKRHANVGRLLRAGWFFGLTERLTED
jgi:hypothetical protein